MISSYVGNDGDHAIDKTNWALRTHDDMTVGVHTIASNAGSATSVTKQTDGKLKYAFNIPKGEKSDKGEPGTTGSRGEPGSTSWNDITDRPDFVTRADAEITYLGKTENAAIAPTADITTTANVIKVTQDCDGNVIFSAYEKNPDVMTIASGTADLTAGSSMLTAGTLYFVYE